MVKRRALRPEAVTLLVSLALILFYNAPLWRYVASITPADAQGFAIRGALGLIILALLNLLLTALAFRFLFKLVATALLMISAAVVYYMGQYGVLIDSEMIRNVYETDLAEVHDLLVPGLWLYLLLLGVLPSWLLWRLPIAWRPWRRELAVKTLIGVGCLGVVAAVALGNYQSLSSFFRNHHELRLMVVPSNYLWAVQGFLRERGPAGEAPPQTVAADAHRSARWAAHRRKSLTVLVVGESARADNFGLLGYTRDTTPRLRSETDLTAFTQVRSCGTETAVSVPCMFSALGRSGYTAQLAQAQEGLLDVLQRASFQVQWWDNQSGCKGTCQRVTFKDLRHRRNAQFCNNGDCYDEILLNGLQDFIDRLDRDTVLVLHPMGSHGPAYFKRYPRRFERFTPVCYSSAFDTCSRQSIVNGYDNTLVYTDYILSRLIDVLRRNQNQLDTAMIYLADHGESLGEYNLFLHGTPYWLAPDQQKHIGMFTWFSQAYQHDFVLDNRCLQAKREQPFSHDYLFHSMLGLLQIDTAAYREHLDIFAGCRTPVPPAVVANR